MNRRTLLKGIAWSAPTATVMTAAPALATSTPGPSRLVFTNATARVGDEPNRIYVNTRVMVTDGPDPVHNVTLSISVPGQEPRLFVWDRLDGWGSTEQVYVEFDVPATTTVTFVAQADDMEPIVVTATVTAPGWWDQ